MSNTEKKGNGSLTVAAGALEAEIKRFEDLVAELGRLGVNSEKSLGRARQLLEEVAGYEQRLGTHLRELSLAMQRSAGAPGSRDEAGARERRADPAPSRGTQRMLLERVNALGERARDINEPMAALSAEEGRPADRRWS